MAGLWFNFTSNDIAKLDMVNLQYFHWRLGSDILSKWNFPVVPSTFYLISMLAVWNVTMYCRNDRWAKARESNRAGFSNEPCLANVKIYFCPWILVHSQVLMVTEVSSAVWLHAGWNTEQSLRKPGMYVCTYIQTWLKNTTKGHIFFYHRLLRLHTLLYYTKVNDKLAAINTL